MELIVVAGIVVVGLLIAVAAYVAGVRVGSNTASTTAVSRRLEEYPSYPFVVNDAGHVEFSPDAFDNAVRQFLDERNDRAARELIVIGEQNLVRDTLPTDRLNRYKRLYAAYDGDSVITDNEQFLENYARIVHHLGRSFRHTGIEILLHNLVNPSRSLVAIENGEVTGRSVGSGATNLVLDLKTRRQRGEDKVNYELNIGARRFKCTTIPIFRPDYGLVGAICMNVDANFMREGVKNDAERLEAFFDNLLRTDFELDENILSKDEYQNALHGKRHFLDEAIRSGGGSMDRQLAAIFFSDIVGFTALMGEDESAGLAVRNTNAEIHRPVLATHRGRMLKDTGDGVLASFASVSEAVAAAQEIQRAVVADGRYQLRIGIHLGEVVVSGDGDVYGDGVNIASRIEAATPPGEIGVSAVVYDNIKNKEGLTATLLGERLLKNVADPVTLYTIDRGP